jgi:hypothetical protein
MEIVSSKIYFYGDIFKNLLILSILWSFLIFAKYKTNFSNQTLIFFIISTFFPFFITNFFFEVEYMWDLILYKNNLNFFRNFEFSLIETKSVSNYFYSFLLALIPLPFLDDVLRVGFTSKFIFLFFLIYLIHIKHINENSLLFLFMIFWPSTILYSSIGLREIFVAITCYFVYVALIEKNLFKWIFAISITLFIKPQNFLILLLISIVFYPTIVLKLRFFYLVIFFSATFYFVLHFFSDYIFYNLNYYKQALYAEDNNLDNYTDIIFDYKIVFLFLESSINFLLSPMPNLISNTFRLFQFLENIVIISLIFVLGYQAFKINKKLVVFLFFSLLLSSGIYGLVTSNPGSIARWRYPFFFTIILLFNFIKQKEKSPK